MGTDLEVVLSKLAEFEAEAKYWFECIGIECPSELPSEVEKMREFLKELAVKGRRSDKFKFTEFWEVRP